MKKNRFFRAFLVNIHTISLFCLLFAPIKIISQHSKKIDSTSVKGQLENKLQKALGSYDFSKAIEISDEMEKYSLAVNDSLFLAYSFSIKAEIYKFKPNIEKAKYNVKKCISIYEKLKYYNSVIELNTSLSYLYNLEGKLDSSNYVLNRVKKYFSDSTGVLKRSYYYNQKIKYFEDVGRLDSAITYSLKSIAINKNSNHTTLTYIYFNLSSLFFTVNDFEKALFYINKSLDEINKSKRNLDLTKFKVIIGKANILYELKEYKKAQTLVTNSKLLLDNDRFLDYSIQAKVLLSKLEFLKNPARKNILPDSLVKNKKLTNAVLFLFYLTQLKQYQDIGDYSSSENIIRKLNKLVFSVSNLGLKKEFYSRSITHWKLKKNLKKSNNAQSKYIAISEKINDQQKWYTFYNLETKHQTEKKDKEITEQQLIINKTENELQKKKSQNNLFIGISIFSIICSLLLWFLFQQRQKRKNQEIVTLKREHQIKTLESLIEGEEKERSRIAKELHDGVNGDLSAIKFKLSSLLEMNNTVIKEAVAMLDRSSKQVRAISHNLVPPSLQNFDLVEATQEYCNNMDESYVTKISFQHIGESLNITKKTQINIYRIIQELITNSIKHAGAAEINVQMSCRATTLQITVEDNGKGYDINKVENKGIGLKNVESRVKYLNANLDVLSNKNGTSITIEFDSSKLDDN